MAYSYSPNPTAGRNPSINSLSGNLNQSVNKFATNQNPNNLVVYTVAGSGTPGMGVPMMIFNNPPTMIATPPPQPGYSSKEFWIALFASVLFVAGSIAWAVSQPVLESCINDCGYPKNVCVDSCYASHLPLKGCGIAFLSIGAVLLLGVRSFVNNKTQRQKYQMLLQIYQQQMQQQQMQMPQRQTQSQSA